MTGALREALAATGQPVPDDPAALTRVVLDSLALRYASVVRTIESLTGERVLGIHVVGGGSRNDYLNQATADAARSSGARRARSRRPRSEICCCRRSPAGASARSPRAARSWPASAAVRRFEPREPARERARRALRGAGGAGARPLASVAGDPLPELEPAAAVDRREIDAASASKATRCDASSVSKSCSPRRTSPRAARRAAFGPPRRWRAGRRAARSGSPSRIISEPEPEALLRADQQAVQRGPRPRRSP